MKESNNILILCAYYTDSNNANGVCARNLAEEFVKRGKKVWAISSSNEKIDSVVLNDVKVYFIETEDYVKKLSSFRKGKGLFNRLGHFFYRLYRNIRLLPTYPNNSPERSRRVYELALNLIDSCSIDTVVGMYKPYESILSCIRVKSKYGNSLKVCTYHLDLLTKHDERKGLSYKIMRNKAIDALKKECNLVDGVLIPENYFEDPVINDSKMYSVGFPLYINRTDFKCSNIQFDENEISLVYIGSLDSNNRNPQYAIQAISLLNEMFDKPVLLHVWGKLWDAETTDIICGSKNVVYHGCIENDYVQDVLQKSDILLNVSNKETYNFLPSKIFQYFALNKAIMNIVQDERDCSLKYFQKYDKAYNIYTYKEFNEQIKGLCDFVIRNCSQLNQNNKQFEDVFLRFTPSFICNTIELINVEDIK